MPNSFNLPLMDPWFVCTSQAARDLEQKTMQETGASERQLMNQAAMGCARAIVEEYPDVKSLLFVLGKGNNANDGILIAELLHTFYPGLDIQAASPWPGARRVDFFFGQTRFDELDLQQAEEWILNHEEDSHALIVDALFGSGLSRDLQAPVTDWIEMINRSSLPVVSIDLPSGLNGNTGAIMNAAVKADLTLALNCLKTGFFMQDGPSLLRKIRLLSVGIPQSLHLQESPLVFTMHEQTAAGFLRKRSLYENKGRFGKVLLAGGSMRMQGALSMAAQACFHAGCGTMTLFTPQDAGKAIASKTDLAMILSAPQDPEGFFDDSSLQLLQQQKDRFTMIGCGSGMGTSSGALCVLKELLSWELPMVVDADGLNLLAKNPELLENRKTPLVLTPHLMEFSRLSGISIPDLEKDPFTHALAFTRRYPQVVLVLKSDVTLIVHNDQIGVVSRPDSRLSKGGSGDVLCGLCTGLCAWNPDSLFETCCAAAWIHNQAADQPDIAPAFFTPMNLIAGFNAVFQRLDALQASFQNC